MYNYNFTDNNNKVWSRIDKRQARRLYNSGETIIIIADNMKPFSMWACEAYLYKGSENSCFDALVDQFEIYNCINRETGYHAAFYMEVENND